jgi:hypothetical protein
MAYRRFASFIPGGKEIDIAIARKDWAKAEALLRKAESALTVKRRERTNRMIKLPKGSKQKQIDAQSITALNRKIDAICATLRGKDPLIKRALKQKQIPKPKTKRRRR